MISVLGLALMKRVSPNRGFISTRSLVDTHSTDKAGLQLTKVKAQRRRDGEPHALAWGTRA